MNNQFADRLKMFAAISALLQTEKHFPVWKAKTPLAFTELAPKVVQMTDAMHDLIAAQQSQITGYAADKAREEKELEDIAHEISMVLSGYHEEKGNHASAHAVYRPLSGWQGLRDVELITHARNLLVSLDAALGRDVLGCARHGLDESDLAQVAKELADFETYVSNPASAITERKSLTNQLRPGFAEIAGVLDQMDRLVLRFRKSSEGAVFADIWKSTRSVKSVGVRALAA